MVQIKEYRVVLPLAVEEYQVAQLFSVIEASRNETGGGEGVEVLKNEPFENHPLLEGAYSSGQYTYKIYHKASKVPGFIRMILPKGSCELHEEAWNAYPYCRTVITNPKLMGEKFKVVIETMHAPDRGDQENVHRLSAEKVKLREVIRIDISNDPVAANDYKEGEDPSKFRSERTNRGPLTGNWIENADPVMTCYKLVTAEFKLFGLQTRVENVIQGFERRLFTNFHRQVFCLMDKWHGLTMEDIRRLEDEIREELNRRRNSGTIRGMVVDSA